ncbi:MAG: hypothetical protein AAF752_15375 [Bacteroidota bacterium]
MHGRLATLLVLVALIITGCEPVVDAEVEPVTSTPQAEVFSKSVIGLDRTDLHFAPVAVPAGTRFDVHFEGRINGKQGLIALGRHYGNPDGTKDVSFDFSTLAAESADLVFLRDGEVVHTAPNTKLNGGVLDVGFTTDEPTSVHYVTENGVTVVYFDYERLYDGGGIKDSARFTLASGEIVEVTHIAATPHTAFDIETEHIRMFSDTNERIKLHLAVTK